MRPFDRPAPNIGRVAVGKLNQCVGMYSGNTLYHHIIIEIQEKVIELSQNLFDRNGPEYA